MATYYAQINNPSQNTASSDVDKHWMWEGESPRYSKDKPVFKAGDKLYIRIVGCRGKHTISLKPALAEGENGLLPLPFGEPHNRPSFEYDAEQPLIIVESKLSQLARWKFTITHPASGPIDPEFQVGTGAD